MSGIVGSYFNTRGSGVVAKLGTDGQIFTSTGLGLSQGFEAAAAGGSRTLLATNTISTNTATSAFDSGVITSTYALYEIHIISMYPETDAVNLEMYWSVDNGSAFLTTIDQISTRQRQGDTGSYTSVTDQNFTLLASSLDDETGSTLVGKINLWNFGATDRFKLSTFQVVHKMDDTNSVRRISGGSMYNDVTAINYVKFQMSADDITAAKIKLYGVT